MILRLHLYRKEGDANDQKSRPDLSIGPQISRPIHLYYARRQNSNKAKAVALMTGSRMRVVPGTSKSGRLNQCCFFFVFLLFVPASRA